ncbi:hypothetical protein [Sphingomonas phage Carli]|nr:hypothetical protein [Sphingomonas phage Carli]
MAVENKSDKYKTIPSPKRLRIVEKLVALLEGINPTNSYIVDLGDPDAPPVEKPFPIDLRGHVFMGRLTVSTEEAEDAMSVLENPRPLDASEVGWDKLLRQGDWILLVQGWPRDDIKNPSRPAYKLAALAEQRLARVVEVDSRGDPMYPEDHLLGLDAEGDPEIIGMSIGQSVVRPPQDTNSRLAMFYIPVVIQLATNPGKPFL